MPSFGKFMGEAARALGKLIAERVAQQEERAAAKMAIHSLAKRPLPVIEQATGEELGSVVGGAGKLLDVGAEHKPGVGLSRRDVMDLLNELHTAAPYQSKEPLDDYADALADVKRMRVLNKIEQHMPLPISIPWDLPYAGSVSDPINRGALESLSVWLSALSRMPKELFKRSGQVTFLYDRPEGYTEAAAHFLPYPVGDLRRRIVVPDIAWQDPREAGYYAVWALTHEAGHSLLDDPQLYDKVLDYLEHTGWKFPTRYVGERPKKGTAGISAATRPEQYEWKAGREYAPKTYKALSMTHRPLWPAEGRPLRPPPGVWSKVRTPSGEIITYAETHPSEDPAEAVAARVLMSHPELLEGAPVGVLGAPARERARALKSNVRYEPITEFLKASGVPLAWLLYLLQRRYDQEGGSQGGTQL